MKDFIFKIPDGDPYALDPNDKGRCYMKHAAEPLDVSATMADLILRDKLAAAMKQNPEVAPGYTADRLAEAIEGRQERARIVAETYIIEEFMVDQWNVTHPTEHDRSYVVDLSSLRGHVNCSCPDYRITSALLGEPSECKHIRALTQHMDLVTARRITNDQAA